MTSTPSDASDHFIRTRPVFTDNAPYFAAFVANSWRATATDCADLDFRSKSKPIISARDSYMDQGIQILNLCQNAHHLFVRQPAREKRSLLNFLLSNSTWAQGKLSVKFKEPFDLLAETIEAAAWTEATQGVESAKNEVWLPFVDVYRTKCVIPGPSFRLRLEQVTRLGLAA